MPRVSLTNVTGGTIRSPRRADRACGRPRTRTTNLHGNYVTTDDDGDEATGTLSINVDDDAPTATAEASQNVAEGATVTGTLDFVRVRTARR